MIVVVDERQIVVDGYAAMFARERISAIGLSPDYFDNWVENASATDLSVVEGFLLGDCKEREKLPRKIRRRSSAPVLAVSDGNSLEHTLNLFQSGMDDVLRKPMHVREIMARINAIRRRGDAEVDKTDTASEIGSIRVFNDGRDPQIHGKDISLPRRERRILEYLVLNRGKRVNKSQIFNAIYGVFDVEVEENVVESHISKLRKKLKKHIGYDVIDSKRFLGYRLSI